MGSYLRVTDEKHVIPLPSTITRAFWSQPVALIDDKVRLHIQTKFVKDGAKVLFKIYLENDDKRTNVLRPEAGKKNPPEGKISKNECYLDFKIDFKEDEIGKNPWKFVFVAEIPDYSLEATSNVLTVKDLLRVRFLDESSRPRANAACEVSLGDSTLEKSTDKDGVLEMMLPMGIPECIVTIEDDVYVQRRKQVSENSELTRQLKVRQLKPVAEPAGQQARLANLGYYRGPLDKTDDAELKSAIEEFQCDYGLPVDGKCGPQTQAKLKEVHGC